MGVRPPSTSHSKTKPKEAVALSIPRKEQTTLPTTRQALLYTHPSRFFSESYVEATSRYLFLNEQGAKINREF